MTAGFPTLLHVLLAGALLLAATTAIGWKYSAWLLPERAEARLLAPAVGLAILVSVSFPVCVAVGMSRASLLAAVALSLLASLFPLQQLQGTGVRVPRTEWQLLGFAAAAALAAIMSCLPLVPQIADGGVALGVHIYDHAKVAIIDEIARSGHVPPANPFFGEAPDSGTLRYYYFLYFIAAGLRTLLGVTGWEADIAMTWFAAFASLLAMGALATRTAGRPRAAWWVLPMSLAGRVRHAAALLDITAIEKLISPIEHVLPWSDQSVWVPQHMMSAVVAVLAIVAIERLVSATNLTLRGSALCAALAASAFGLSAWVGGITLAVALAAVLAVLVVVMRRSIDCRMAAFHLVMTGALAVVIASPLLVAQMRFAAGAEFPVQIETLAALVKIGGKTLARICYIIGYWIVFLPLELSAVFLPGVLGLWLVRLDPGVQSKRWRLVSAVAVVACLLVAQFMKSVVGSNDLGWRAVIPATLILTSWAAALADRAVSDLGTWPNRFCAGLIAVLLAITLPAGLIANGHQASYLYLAAEATAEQVAFAQAPRLWAAVRRYAARDERVLNNPLAFATMTAWPVNIGWALLADRRSCAAAADLMWTFVQMPRERSLLIQEALDRFFAGDAQAQDLDYIFGALSCRIIVLTPADGAWAGDVLARIPGLVLLEEQPQEWRIYRWKPDLK